MSPKFPSNNTRLRFLPDLCHMSELSGYGSALQQGVGRVQMPLLDLRAKPLTLQLKRDKLIYKSKAITIEREKETRFKILALLISSLITLY